MSWPRKEDKDRYAADGFPHDCGDEVAVLIRTHTWTNGKPDAAKFAALCAANGFSYDSVPSPNEGAKRTNAGNRLRSIAKNGPLLIPGKVA